MGAHPRSNHVRDVPTGAVDHVGVRQVDILIAALKDELDGANDAHMDRCLASRISTRLECIGSEPGRDGAGV